MVKIRIIIEEMPQLKGEVKPLLPFSDYDSAVDWLRLVESVHRERVENILSEFKEKKENG